MVNVMEIKSFLKRSLVYYIYIQYKLLCLKKVKKRFLLREAKILFANERPQHGNLTDYKLALKKNFVTYSEYMYQYEFWKLNEEDRDMFISRNEVIYILTKKIYLSNYYNTKITAPEIFSNKLNFLKYFSDYVHRKWLVVNNSSYDVFVDFLKNTNNVIVKPIYGNCGKGVSLISEKENLEDLYFDYCKNNMIIEECIQGCDEIQSFHPKSLNTIRVVTVIDDKHNVVVFGAVLRMGTGGAIIDNAHAGGIFAKININTGIVESNAIDTKGNTFFKHCDSNKDIKGFKIPCWEKIKDTCVNASLLIKDKGIIIGWDVVVNKKYQIEFVEGNFCPDFDIMQSPLKKGVKKEILKYIEN